AHDPDHKRTGRRRQDYDGGEHRDLSCTARCEGADHRLRSSATVDAQALRAGSLAGTVDLLVARHRNRRAYTEALDSKSLAACLRTDTAKPGGVDQQLEDANSDSRGEPVLRSRVD